MNRENKQPFIDGSSIKKKSKFLDSNGKEIARLNDNVLYDSNNKVLGNYAGSFTDNGSEVQRFTSRKGTFNIKDGKLYKKDVLIGQAIKKAKLIPILISSVAIALVAVIVVVAVVSNLKPVEEYEPIIVIEDASGVWQDNRTIAVFDGSISPGKHGNYAFMLKNTNEYDVDYAFVINHIYNGKKDDNFPLVFRIRAGHEYLHDGWLTVKDLEFQGLTLSQNEQVRVMVEWSWPFEGGNDSLDTWYGVDSGVYSLDLFIKAQVGE